MYIEIEGECFVNAFLCNKAQQPESPNPKFNTFLSTGMMPQVQNSKP